MLNLDDAERSGDHHANLRQTAECTHVVKNLSSQCFVASHPLFLFLPLCLSLPPSLSSFIPLPLAPPPTHTSKNLRYLFQWELIFYCQGRLTFRLVLVKVLFIRDTGSPQLARLRRKIGTKFPEEPHGFPLPSYLGFFSSTQPGPQNPQ